MLYSIFIKAQTLSDGSGLDLRKLSPWQIVQASIDEHPNTKETFKKLILRNHLPRETLLGLITDGIEKRISIENANPEKIREYFLKIVPQVEWLKPKWPETVGHQQDLTREQLWDIVNDVINPQPAIAIQQQEKVAA